MGLEPVILAVIIGTLAAIVYSMRVLVLMERRVARIDAHIEALVTKVFETELQIEQEEDRITGEERRIEAMLVGRKSAPKKKSSRRAPAKKKNTKKKPAKKKRR